MVTVPVVVLPPPVSFDFIQRSPKIYDSVTVISTPSPFPGGTDSILSTPKILNRSRRSNNDMATTTTTNETTNNNSTTRTMGRIKGNILSTSPPSLVPPFSRYQNDHLL